MRPFFNLLTIISFVAGFFLPILWIVTIVSIFLAMGSSSGGRREDGKAKTGGLLGGVWDKMVVNEKMHKCPYCKSMIFKDAQKCKNCGEWVNESPKSTKSTNTQKYPHSFKHKNSVISHNNKEFLVGNKIFKSSVEAKQYIDSSI